MIISKTPLRLSLAGGGTDLPEFYSQYGSHIITSAINKHIYIFVKNWFDPAVRVSYSITEIVNNISEIKHPVVRAALEYLKMKSHIEIAIMADLPAGTGMGSSGGFTVGLLNALHAFKEKKLPPKTLAELAFHIQHDILKEAGGKQDQYAASFGGIISMHIQKDGKVSVKKLDIKKQHIQSLEERLLCFYTGIRRSAHEIQNKYCKSIANNHDLVIESLHKIKNISKLMQNSLEKGDIDEIGSLFEDHWNAKTMISREISNNTINKWHDTGINAGAIGGKMLGAGGGGYMVFLCKDNKKNAVKNALNRLGLVDVPIKFHHEGSKTFEAE